MTIENGLWWTKSWSPIKVKDDGGWHCTKCSPGCKNCWAETYNIRFGNYIDFYHHEFPVEFELDQRILERPLHWKKPRIVAVQWLGDLFHEQIPDDFREEIFSIMERTYKRHKYLLLTKRVKNMMDFVNHPTLKHLTGENVWFGISISTQKEADDKIIILLETPAAHRYINFEPLLSEIDLMKLPIFEEHGEIFGIDWILLGAESGPGRRSMKLEWARSIAGQCETAGIPLWVKQLDINGKVSKKMEEWPEDLRIRQWPW